MRNAHWVAVVATTAALVAVLLLAPVSALGQAAADAKAGDTADDTAKALRAKQIANLSSTARPSEDLWITSSFPGASVRYPITICTSCGTPSSTSGIAAASTG